MNNQLEEKKQSEEYKKVFNFFSNYQNESNGINTNATKDKVLKFNSFNFQLQENKSNDVFLNSINNNIIETSDDFHLVKNSSKNTKKFTNEIESTKNTMNTHKPKKVLSNNDLLYINIHSDKFDNKSFINKNESINSSKLLIHHKFDINNPFDFINFCQKNDIYDKIILNNNEINYNKLISQDQVNCMCLNCLNNYYEFIKQNNIFNN